MWTSSQKHTFILTFNYEAAPRGALSLWLPEIESSVRGLRCKYRFPPSLLQPRRLLDWPSKVDPAEVLLGLPRLCWTLKGTFRETASKGKREPRRSSVSADNSMSAWRDVNQVSIYFKLLWEMLNYRAGKIYFLPTKKIATISWNGECLVTKHIDQKWIYVSHTTCKYFNVLHFIAWFHYLDRRK